MDAVMRTEISQKLEIPEDIEDHQFAGQEAKKPVALFVLTVFLQDVYFHPVSGFPQILQDMICQQAFTSAGSAHHAEIRAFAILYRFYDGGSFSLRADPDLALISGHQDGPRIG